MKNINNTVLEIINHIVTNHDELLHDIKNLVDSTYERHQWSLVDCLPTTKERFTKIYVENLWGCAESRSGTGSTIKYTENIRSAIPLILAKYGIKIVLDAPCGDFNWMSSVIESVNVSYIGVDIVDEIIVKNQLQYGGDRVKFNNLDITKDPLPAADLLICRDCLFHLSNSDIRSFLINFASSQIKYLLTTTHVNRENKFHNEDINTGGFRLIDLFRAPFCFPSNPLERIDDWMHPEPEREMCLWTQDQIKAML